MTPEQQAAITTAITAAYVVAFGMFITGLAKLTSPTTAVQGNKIAAVGTR